MTTPEKDCESYARECVRLSELTEDPRLQTALMQMAREWMAAAIEEDGTRKTSTTALWQNIAR
jgi:hypothetical protein